MKKFPLQFSVHRNPATNGVEIRGWREFRDGAVAVIEDVTMKEYGGDDELPSHAPLHLDPKEAQGLLEALWRAGFRPQDGTGSSAVMEKVEAHLQDMRELAFQALQIKKPESK